ncbi:hypothetical protein HanLR1_Chr11g0383731 [Helianthus annuus]|nr:hypothetical protein HanHA89_Chr11g0406231 [Helianthus annuus]KAJ0683746.1 hypothetical protein HanLR1_Chr11g0383731 [Helianthus annuus]
MIFVRPEFVRLCAAHVPPYLLSYMYLSIMIVAPLSSFYIAASTNINRAPPTCRPHSPIMGCRLPILFVYPFQHMAQSKCVLLEVCMCRPLF